MFTHIKSIQDKLGADFCICKPPTVNGSEADFFRSVEVKVEDKVTEGHCVCALDETGLSMYTITKIMTESGTSILAATNQLTIDAESCISTTDPDSMSKCAIEGILSSASSVNYTTRVKEPVDLSDTHLKNAAQELHRIRTGPAKQGQSYMRCVTATENIILPWYKARLLPKGYNVATRMCNQGKLWWPPEKVKANAVEIFLDWKEICALVDDMFVMKDDKPLNLTALEEMRIQLDADKSRELLKSIKDRQHKYSESIMDENTSNSLWVTMELGSHCISVGMDDRADFTHALFRNHLAAVLSEICHIVKVIL